MTFSYRTRISIGMAGTLAVILGFFLPWYVSSDVTFTGWLYLTIFIAPGHLNLNGVALLFLLGVAFLFFFAALALASGFTAYFQKHSWLSDLYQRLGVLGLIIILTVWFLGHFLLTSAGLWCMLLGFVALLGSGLLVREL